MTDDPDQTVVTSDYAGTNLTVKSHDEIGRLARTFNVLIDVPRQRERERKHD
jgi:hypothetical protein